MKKMHEIEKNIIETAKNIAAKIEDETLRKRSYALAIGALTLAKQLKNDYDISCKHSLFKLPAFAQSFEIADLYTPNARIDVRVTFENDIFYIPKTHKKYAALPDFYIIVKMDKELSQMCVSGFISPSDLDEEDSQDEYFVYETSILKPMKSFKKALKEVSPSIHSFSSEEHQKISELTLSFFDGEISESEKIFYIKHVILCEICRERICEFGEFDTIIAQVKNYPELLDDSTLDILTGNSILAQKEKEEEPDNEILETEISSSMFDLVKDMAQDTAELGSAAAAGALAGGAAGGAAAAMQGAAMAQEAAFETLDVVQNAVETFSDIIQEPQNETESSDTSTFEDVQSSDFNAEDFSLLEDESEASLDDLTDSDSEQEPEEAVESAEETQDIENEEVTEETVPEEEESSEPITVEQEQVQETADALLDSEPDAEKNDSLLTNFDDEHEEMLFEEDAQTLHIEEAEEEAAPSFEETPTAEPQEDAGESQMREEIEAVESHELHPIEQEEEFHLEEETGLELGDLDVLDETDDLLLEEHHEESVELNPEEIVENTEELQISEEQTVEEPISLNNDIDVQEDIEALEEPILLEEIHTADDELLLTKEPAAEEAQEKDEPQQEYTLDESGQTLEQEAEINEINRDETILQEDSDVVLPEENLEETVELEPGAGEDYEILQEQDAVREEPALTEQEPAESEQYSGIEIIDEDDTPVDEPVSEPAAPEYSGIESIDEDSQESQSSSVEETNSVDSQNSAPQESESDINPEIQNLLDDELLQLLSDGDDTAVDSSEASSGEEAAQMPQEDAVAGMEDEEDEAVNQLYETQNDNETEDEPAQMDFTKEPAANGSLAKKIIAAVVVLFLITAGSVTALYLNFNKNNAEEIPDLPGSENMPLTNTANQPSQSAPEPAMSQDLNKSMTNVFSEQPGAITITKISWEVSQKLAADPSFKNYLQVAGKNLQMNLQNDLSYTTDVNYNNKIKISMEIGKDNSIKRIQATESSGSEQIDKVVLQSIKDTLKYINVPDIKDYEGNYNLSVLINF